MTTDSNLQLSSGHRPVNAADWSLKITRIEVGGVETQAIANLQFTPPRSAQTETLRDVKLGKTFPEGSTLAAPARTLIVLQSSNNNEVRLSPGSRIKISAGSQMGEEYEQETGKSFFNVKRALNFFNVRHRHFQALVKGTRYSVKVEPQKEITFAVEEGAVKIAREGKIKIEEGDRESTLTETLILQAGDTKTYRLDLDAYLKTFKHYGDAESYYRQNLEADRNSGDADRIEEGLNYLGNALVILSQYQAAIPYFEECLQSTRQRHPGGLNINISIALNSLGTAYSLLGGSENFKRAIGYQEESLNIRRQIFSSDVHNDIAMNLNNLGESYRKLGGTENIQRAIGYYEDALKIRRQLFPSGGHNGIASNLNNLGGAYQSLGGTENIQRAIGYAEEALKTSRLLFPSGVRNDIANNLTNLGVAYSRLGGTANIKRGIGYFEEGLKIRRQIFPSGVRNDIANNLSNLGLAYRNLGGTENVKRAIDYYEEALKIMRIQVPDGVHPLVPSMLNGMGKAHDALGNQEKAQGYFDEASKVRAALGL